MSTTTADILRADLRWLEDPTMYARVKPRPARTASYFSAADVAAMLETGKISPAPVTSDRTVPGSVNAFWVAEPKKRRRRPIFEALSNRDLGKETLRQLRHLSRAQTHAQAKGGGLYSLSFDLAGFYDALPLSPEVRQFFRFRIHKILYELNCLAMGQRQACEVAQAVCDAICDFPRPDVVQLATYIDNIRFISSCPRALASTVRTFLRRIKEVGLDLNTTNTCEAPTKRGSASFLNIQEWLALSDEAMTARCNVEEDFLGSFYNYREGTVRNTPNCISKLREVVTSRCYLSSRRRFVALMGLLNFMSATTSLSLAPYFSLLRFFRGVASAGAATGWDVPLAPMPDTAQEELHQLSTILLANSPHTITDTPSPSHEWDKIIISDASGEGWGALCYVPASGAMAWHSAKWPGHVGHSAIAEPRGLRLACRRFLAATTTENVLLITDHRAIAEVGGGRPNPHAKGYELNLLFLDLLAFPAASFSFAHVAGVLNPTDVLSRDFVTKHGECWDGDLARLRLTFFDGRPGCSPATTTTTTGA